MQTHSFISTNEYYYYTELICSLQKPINIEFHIHTSTVRLPRTWPTPADRTITLPTPVMNKQANVRRSLLQSSRITHRTSSVIFHLSSYIRQVRQRLTKERFSRDRPTYVLSRYRDPT